MRIRVPNPNKTPKGRLHTPAPKVFRNKRNYTRKTKYPEMGQHGPQNYGLQMGNE